MYYMDSLGKALVPQEPEAKLQKTLLTPYTYAKFFTIDRWWSWKRVG